MIKGWYQVHGNKYHSKVQALMAAGNNSSLISYHWMPDLWNSVDFSTEPTESWSELLRLRCQALRDQHDWLQLFFSGGWDSTTVLDAFATHRIPLDEIIIFNRTYVADPEIDSAKQHALEIKNSQMPRVKITVLDVEHNFSDHFFNEYRDQWILCPGANMRYTRWPDRMNVFRYSKSYMDGIRNHGRVGLIEGKDKPRLLCRDGSWYAFFVDGNTIDTNLSPVVDFFYDPRLHVKQTHMACRWFESRAELRADRQFVHQLQSHSVDGPVYQQFNQGIGRTCTRNTHAQQGRMKLWNENNTNAWQSRGISQHERSSQSSSWQLYTHGIREIQKLTGLDLTQAQLPSFITQQYFVKNIADNHT